jgi:hypothetical protein
MRTTLIGAAALAAAALLTAPGLAGDYSTTAVSGEAVMDTRTRCAAFLAEDEALDSRSFTVDLSDDIRLNTKKIAGTMIMFK